ncbi:GAF domain-containing protein [Streptomyces sp. NPDC058739]|uniref:GAF domain-containing protein n=1 Tax=Streptomyces sp. NPDC058739 TaxID=3346618 RepID=UPI0036BA9ED0
MSYSGDQYAPDVRRTHLTSLPQRPSQRLLTPDAVHRNSSDQTEQPPADLSHASELMSRINLIQELGLPTQADPTFDEFAQVMAHKAGFLYGFVNLFLTEQTFIGLHQPSVDSGYVVVERTMSREHGWCPEVVSRKKALPLHDVHASPRFSGNHVVDAVGIRSYFGAPLIHDSGTVLGTVCVIDPETRPLQEARRLRDVVIATSDDVMRYIERFADR